MNSNSYCLTLMPCYVCFTTKSEEYIYIITVHFSMYYSMLSKEEKTRQYCIITFCRSDAGPDAAV